ncbi:putative 39S ribosomal protein L46 [Helianthus annuus]|nr:putative 39S ribosomal protein L46 [Helianthus annuus]
MQRSCRSLSRFLTSNRGFCTSTKGADNEKIVASVLFERLPVIIPKIDPVVYAFQEFSLVISILIFMCILLSGKMC